MRNHRDHLAGRFEQYREIADVLGDMGAMAEVIRRYALDMSFESVPELCRRLA